MLGVALNEMLGKIHFWITFAGVYCIFMPMHWLGLLDRTRGGISSMHNSGWARSFITTAVMLTIAAQALFLFNFVWSPLHRRGKALRNPWRATTLEWFLPAPIPADNFGE